MQNRILLGIVFLMIGFVGSSEVSAQTYRERQLRKLYLKKTQKPLPAEKIAQQKKWRQLKIQHDTHQRIKKQRRVQERIHYGKQVANKQAHPDPLNPLKQQGRIGAVLHISSIATQDAVDRQRGRDILFKKSQRYKSRNLLNPSPPALRIQFRQR